MSETWRSHLTILCLTPIIEDVIHSAGKWSSDTDSSNKFRLSCDTGFQENISYYFVNVT